ncbi:MAG: hypothetical protein OEZ22_07375 [Spirochaetia bacterium]|nr:hypothetical protein [Spirochaetia bacterium]
MKLKLFFIMILTVSFLRVTCLTDKKEEIDYSEEFERYQEAENRREVECEKALQEEDEEGLRKNIKLLNCEP